MSVESRLAVDRSVLEAYASRRAEPRWMAERRAEALRQFQEIPMPQWDRTDLSQFDMEGYLERLRRQLEASPGSAAPVDLDTGGPAEASLLPPAVAESLVHVPKGGAVLAHVVPGDDLQPAGAVRWMDPELRRRGVRVMSLHEALAADGELVRSHFMTRAVLPQQGKFQALHGAAWDVGSVIYVPPGVELEQPVQLITWMAAGRALLFPHTLIVLDRQARLTVVEAHVSPDGEAEEALPPLVVGAVEIVAGPGSRIDYVSVQAWGRRVLSFSNRRAVLERDSQVEWVLGEFGCALGRGEFESALKGSGAVSHSVLVFMADRTQHLDLSNRMDHRGDHTQSDIVARGVLSGQARGIYRALTHIHTGARASNAYQKGNILVLDPQARADANPSVVVEESEVERAGHAATVGQVDRDQLFYLMSRGLPEKVAIRLIVEGFLQPVVDRIPVEAVQERIRHLVAAKLEGA